LSHGATIALYRTETLFCSFFLGGIKTFGGATFWAAASIAAVGIHASTRVPPQALWISAIGRPGRPGLHCPVLQVCILAMSRTVMKHTAEKFAMNVFGNGDLGSFPGCTLSAISVVSHWLHGLASQAQCGPDIFRSNCGVLA